MKTIKLCQGIGEEGKSHCVMAATSIVAEEKFSDKPSCVCPTITAALIHVNDKCPTNDIRERLLGHLPWIIIGTRGDVNVAITRAKLFAAWAESEASASSSAWAAAKAAAKAAKAAESAAESAWESEMKKFISFIEEKIIPIHTTMPIEPGFRIEQLVAN